MSSDPELKQMMQAQVRLIELITTRFATMGSSSPSVDPTLVDHMARNIHEFLYDPDVGVSFESWYKRYKDFSTVELVNGHDETKVRLLLRKLGPAEHVRYLNYILPAKPQTLSFADTVEKLTRIFGDTRSLFNARFQRLQLAKRDDDDFVTYAGLVNRECGRFKLGSLTEDQIRCLVFICGLQAPSYADLRTRLLTMINQQPETKLERMVDECGRLINLKHDSTMIQNPDRAPRLVHMVSKPRSPTRAGQYSHDKSPSACRAQRWVLLETIGGQEQACLGPKIQASRQTGWQIIQYSGHFQSQCRRESQPPTITIISGALWRKLGSFPVHRSSQAATSACGDTVHLTGQLHCLVSFRAATINGTCYVSDTDLNLLGLDRIEQLDLLDLPIWSICNRVRSVDTHGDLSDHIPRQFAPVFQNGLGKPTGLPTQTAGTICSPSSGRSGTATFGTTWCPELGRILCMGRTDCRVEEVQWVHPDLCRFLHWAQCELGSELLPVPKDLFTMLNGGTCFAKLDLVEAYFQIQVAPESRELVTINTHRGLFQYTRIPFGVKTVPATFQQIIDAMISGLPGTAAYLDDIILMGRSTEELHSRIVAVLQRIQNYGFRLKSEKCQFFLPSIKTTYAASSTMLSVEFQSPPMTLEMQPQRTRPSYKSWNTFELVDLTFRCPEKSINYSFDVVVSSSLRRAVLHQFHSGHPGTSRMRAIARGFAYWPGMDDHISELVKHCSKCQQAAKLPKKQDPVPWDLPKGPWLRIHLDFAGPINGVMYLVLVDVHSKWPEIVPLHSATSSTTIAALRRIFSQHDFPEILVSDNGSQFSSTQFRDFCSRSNFQHVSTPPYHPQSNGQVERFVDTLKRALLISREEETMDEFLQTFLLVYRSTPNPAAPDGCSPSEVLMGRKLRTVLHAVIPTDTLLYQPGQTDVHCECSIGSPVYVCDYRPTHEEWIDELVKARRMKVLLEVSVGNSTWIHHRNQLRSRHPDASMRETQQALLLDILLDTFTIPTIVRSPIPTTDLCTNDRLFRRRWTDRVRRPVRPLQVTPRAKR
ncbi:uncharacterized protein DEA37_0007238 [Paragonimus westermani]|uniref:Integrase catalytic domain-containing protein n=1 Tax=Paragonimus westermani TaxID=34504 RepID=A0A5J4NN91_9TREM|nr:uncharacterized protein DEA37_0007238 [Paragonimus westermani]